ncbi:MAG: hypothetical protein WDN31_03410 [Hyphomicrobium sp.]
MHPLKAAARSQGDTLTALLCDNHARDHQRARRVDELARQAGL